MGLGSWFKRAAKVAPSGQVLAEPLIASLGLAKEVSALTTIEGSAFPEWWVGRYQGVALALRPIGDQLEAYLGAADEETDLYLGQRGGHFTGADPKDAAGGRRVAAVEKNATGRLPLQGAAPRALQVEWLLQLFGLAVF